MADLHQDTLRVAQTLLTGAEEDGFALRRAVSSAYYALFQCLCAVVAESMSRSDSLSSEYRRAFRALDHRQCRISLNQNAEFKNDLGVPFAELQDVRQWADYSAIPHPDDLIAKTGVSFTHSQAHFYYRKAAIAIAFLGGFDLAQKTRLMVTLIVKERP